MAAAGGEVFDEKEPAIFQQFGYAGSVRAYY
jgi:hypothetical protein